MEREAGGGWGWGTHVNPWLIHVNVWQNPLQYCKVILIKINKKRKTNKQTTLIPTVGRGRGNIRMGREIQTFRCKVDSRMYCIMGKDSQYSVIIENVK